MVRIRRMVTLPGDREERRVYFSHRRGGLRSVSGCDVTPRPPRGVLWRHHLHGVWGLPRWWSVPPEFVVLRPRPWYRCAPSGEVASCAPLTLECAERT